MRLNTLALVIASGVFVAPAVAAAQGPVAVPIVGSPAAGQAPAMPAFPGPPPPAATVTAPSAPAPAPQALPARGARKLDLTFKNGTIALDAQNVTLREILTEWQRRGGCRFVNVEKLTNSAPVTRQFPAGTPELDALDSLMRDLRTDSTGYGYIVGPPATQRAENQSFCGAVYILASSRPSASGYIPAGGSPVAAPLVMPGSPDDELPPVVPFQPPLPRPNPGVPQDPASPNPPPAAPTGGFGPVVPSATVPGAGRGTAPPPNQPPGGGRGGNQAP